MKYPWVKYNHMTERFDYLWFLHGFNEEMGKHWRMFQRSSPRTTDATVQNTTGENSTAPLTKNPGVDTPTRLPTPTPPTRKPNPHPGGKPNGSNADDNKSRGRNAGEPKPEPKAKAKGLPERKNPSEEQAGAHQRGEAAEEAKNDFVTWDQAARRGHQNCKWLQRSSHRGQLNASFDCHKQGMGLG